MPTLTRSRARVVISTLAAISLCAARPAAAQSYTFGGHTYFLTKTAEDWNAAEAEAAANGGHLAAVNSAAENVFLATTFASGSLPRWLGGTDLVSGVQTHTYHWTTGEPFAYTNWQPGEPNDFGGFEDYTTINWHFSQGGTSDHSTWNDTGLNGTNIGPYFGIVEVAAPEPTQSAAFALGAFGLTALAFRARRRGTLPR